MPRPIIAILTVALVVGVLGWLFGSTDSPSSVVSSPDGVTGVADATMSQTEERRKGIQEAVSAYLMDVYFRGVVEELVPDSALHLGYAVNHRLSRVLIAPPPISFRTAWNGKLCDAPHERRAVIELVAQGGSEDAETYSVGFPLIERYERAPGLSDPRSMRSCATASSDDTCVEVRHPDEAGELSVEPGTYELRVGLTGSASCVITDRLVIEARCGYALSFLYPTERDAGGALYLVRDPGAHARQEACMGWYGSMHVGVEIQGAVPYTDEELEIMRADTLNAGAISHLCDSELLAGLVSLLMAEAEEHKTASSEEIAVAVLDEPAPVLVAGRLSGAMDLRFELNGLLAETWEAMEASRTVSGADAVDATPLPSELTADSLAVAIVDVIRTHQSDSQ